MRLWAWGQSDPGRKRERNEDAYLVDPETGILAVADGMGGHQGGATASRMAVEFLGRELADARGNFEKALATQLQASLRTTEEMPAVDPLMDSMSMPTSPRSISESAAAFAVTPIATPSIRGEQGRGEQGRGEQGRGEQGKAEPSPVRGDETTMPQGAPAFSPALELMRGVVKRASGAIFEASWNKPELRGMGTTLTAVLVHGGRAHLVHAGDSRCYMFRDGHLKQLSDDHSWIAEQLRSGQISEAEAKSSKFRHVITKSIGFERDIEADMKSVPVSAGDCFLLCSDGMSNYIEHGELERIVAMTWYRRLPETLIELANNRGGDDNITVVVGLVANAPSTNA